MLCQECNGKVSKNAKFCPECGAATPQPAGKQRKQKRVKRKHRKHQPVQPPGSREPSRDGYDGYYDNIRPADKGNVDMEGLDKSTWKKVGLIAAGAIVIILACVALLLTL